MNAQISVFVICVESILYLLLYNLNDCTFKYSTIYINVFLKVSLVLIKLNKIAVSGIFVSICFLMKLLLPKETIPSNTHLTKKRKNDPEANPSFHTLRHSLSTIF